MVRPGKKKKNGTGAVSFSLSSVLPEKDSLKKVEIFKTLVLPLRYVCASYTDITSTGQQIPSSRFSESFQVPIPVHTIFLPQFGFHKEISTREFTRCSGVLYDTNR